MLIRSISLSDHSIRQYDFIVSTNNYDYGIKFDSEINRDADLLRYILMTINYNNCYYEQMKIYIKIAEHINILDKVKSILVFTKYKDLL